MVHVLDFNPPAPPPKKKQYSIDDKMRKFMCK